MMTRWRSILFVPATRPDMAMKTLRCRPDAVILDLEDAVPPSDKRTARRMLPAMIDGLAGHVDVLVRVNAVGTPWFADDVAALPAELAGVVVPKYEASVDISLPVIAGLETALGVVDARHILVGAAGCYFGAEDYIADLGGVRTPVNDEIAVPRAMVALAARVCGVPAYDMVTLDVLDTARCGAEAAQARALGYAGKLCIHPAQVSEVNKAFVPSGDELARAERLLSAFEAAGGATIAFEGVMVDEVIARQARALLDQRGASSSHQATMTSAGGGGRNRNDVEGP